MSVRRMMVHRLAGEVQALGQTCEAAVVSTSAIAVRGGPLELTPGAIRGPLGEGSTYGWLCLFLPAKVLPPTSRGRRAGKGLLFTGGHRFTSRPRGPFVAFAAGEGMLALPWRKASPARE